MSPRRSSALELALALVLLFTDGQMETSHTAGVLNRVVSRPPSGVALVTLVSNSPRYHTTRPHDLDQQLGVRRPIGKGVEIVQDLLGDFCKLALGLSDLHFHGSLRMSRFRVGRPPVRRGIGLAQREGTAAPHFRYERLCHRLLESECLRCAPVGHWRGYSA